jgi:signal transduction histidine kinase/DNA-binding response OmpR family regulator
VRTLSVLMLEDSALDAELILSALQTEDLRLDVVRVDSRREFVQRLEQRCWDLILADYQLPGFDGITALQLAWLRQPDTPFLFVSGALGEELAIETLKSGATDYVLKDRLDRLLPSVRRALREAEERQVRLRAERSLRFVAEASAELARSLDYPTTLKTASRIPVPFLADWTVVFALEEDETLQPVAAFHREPQLRELAESFLGRAAGEYGIGPFAREMVSIGIPLLLPEIGQADLARAAPDAEVAQRLLTLGFHSLIVVALRTRRRMLGALALVTTSDDRRYTAEDLSLAEDLGRRIALALDAARLHLDVQLADRRKDEFLAMLAHELRNPLAPILTAVEIARAADLADGRVRRAHDVVERQARHMARLVDDLLDVSRITRGKVELRRERVELGEMIHHAVQTSRPLIDQRRHTLAVELPGNPIPLDADPARMEQVLTNLLNNAAKYTEPGGRISVRAERLGEEVLIAVSDTGVGIPREMLRRVFEPFVQVKPELDRSHGGLGLGLTLVKMLVELHGGAVSAHSEGPGRGSGFEVRVPLARGEPPRLQPAAFEEVAGARRVFVAEDNDDAREFLRDLLELWGHEVEVASDGVAAAERCARGAFDLALIDIGLPGMNGFEVARRVRAAEATRSRAEHTILVALTGYGQPEDRRRALEAGFDEHRVKPLDARELRALLTLAFDTPSPMRSAV